MAKKVSAKAKRLERQLEAHLGLAFVFVVVFLTTFALVQANLIARG